MLVYQRVHQLLYITRQTPSVMVWAFDNLFGIPEKDPVAANGKKSPPKQKEMDSRKAPASSSECQPTFCDWTGLQSKGLISWSRCEAWSKPRLRTSSCSHLSNAKRSTPGRVSSALITSKQEKLSTVLIHANTIVCMGEKNHQHMSKAQNELSGYCGILNHTKPCILTWKKHKNMIIFWHPMGPRTPRNCWATDLYWGHTGLPRSGPHHGWYHQKLGISGDWLDFMTFMDWFMDWFYMDSIWESKLYGKAFLETVKPWLSFGCFNMFRPFSGVSTGHVSIKYNSGNGVFFPERRPIRAKTVPCRSFS